MRCTITATTSFELDGDISTILAALRQMPGVREVVASDFVHSDGSKRPYGAVPDGHCVVRQDGDDYNDHTGETSYWTEWNAVPLQDAADLISQLELRKFREYEVSDPEWDETDGLTSEAPPPKTLTVGEEISIGEGAIIPPSARSWDSSRAQWAAK